MTASRGRSRARAGIDWQNSRNAPSAALQVEQGGCDPLHRVRRVRERARMQKAPRGRRAAGRSCWLCAAGDTRADDPKRARSAREHDAMPGYALAVSRERYLDVIWA